MTKEISPIAQRALDIFGTQAKIVEETGINKGTVSHWFNGRNGPGREHADLLLHAIQEYYKKGPRDTKDSLPYSMRWDYVDENQPVILQSDDGLQYSCKRTSSPEKNDLVFVNGKPGHWHVSKNHPEYFIFEPADGSPSDFFAGKPDYIVLGTIQPVTETSK